MADEQPIATLEEAGQQALEALTTQSEEQPTQEAPSPEAPVAAPQTAQAVEALKIEDDKLYQVDWSETPVTGKEAKAAMLRHADYTQKTQTVAQQRQELEAFAKTMQDREAKINAFLQDPAQVMRYYYQTFGTKPEQEQAPQIDPEAPVTYQQMRQIVEQELSQLKTQTEAEAAAAREQATLHSEAAAIDSDIKTTISSLLDQNPALKQIKYIDKILRAEVLQKDPNTVEEIRSALQEAAREQVEALNLAFTEKAKVQAVNQTQLTQGGIEPPGGTGVLPSPKKFSLDDPELDKAAAAALDGLMRANG